MNLREKHIRKLKYFIISINNLLKEKQFFYKNDNPEEINSISYLPIIEKKKSQNSY